MSHHIFRRHFFLIAILVLQVGCVVGPDYKRPVQEDAPEAFVETGPWKAAAPRDHLPKGEWWTIYKDPVLNKLAAQATQSSPDIRIALARLNQARATAGVESAEFYPGINANADADRSRTPPSRRSSASTSNHFSLGVDLRYEIDLWGRVKRLDESAAARVAASEADFHNVLLGLQADTARAYFSLRALDAERALDLRNIESRKRSLTIVQRRHERGMGSELDTRLAEAELATAESDLLEIDRRRTALRYSLAVLCGQNPAKFSIDENPSVAQIAPPAIPVGLPSELLERRPDIASAERMLASVNADIGVAKAAFFPSIVIFGSVGYGTVDIETLVDWSSRQWSLGPALKLPIFDGGRNTANYQRAQAHYEEGLANYRKQVLAAFAEVETCLSDLRHLAARSVIEEHAVAASKRAATLVSDRWLSGLVSYMDVTEAERRAITNERLAVQARGQQLIASVLLVKAIGGGW
ncbi:MAG: efflux transporter outer membrane subunit [Puniceicoccales bacterium]|jgi:multidrug efflux system outer membrane protein|nr:efflux transporter outer membrane subunit [Puniceicoccales bacterium]